MSDFNVEQGDFNFAFSEQKPVRKEVLDFLSLLGYCAKEYDSLIIDQLVKKVESDIMEYCNLSQIPDELNLVVLYRSMGEFISVKKNCGQTDGFKLLNFEPVLSRLSEGDTSISYHMRGTRSDERRLNLLIAALIGYGKTKLAKYRRLVW